MFSHILCATDLSPRSDAALNIAVHMAARYGSTLLVLNVHDEFMDKEEMVMLRVSTDQMQERFRKIAIEAREEMEAKVTTVGVDDLAVDYLIHEGKPAEAILRMADEITTQGDDECRTLIVMGTNGRDSLMDHVFGSVAEIVVRNSRHPVLVVPGYSRD